jgi:radical SAM superfamily enzyme YgiQ (UPF0313 family)
MRVVLLDPPLGNRTIARDMAGGLGFGVGSSTILPPLNLAVLASVLRANGHTVAILDPQVESLSREAFVEKIVLLDPEIIVGNVSLPTLRNDASFLKELRKTTGVKIVAKTEISFTPILEEILTSSEAELCIFGECEESLELILKGLSTSGVCLRENGEFKHSTPAPVADLDTIPFAARDLLRNDRYLFPLLGEKTTTIQTSRGCPFSCAYYCPYPLIQGQKWRAMSAQRVYEELRDAIVGCGISNVLFRDACFTLDKERAAQICELIVRNNLTLNWWCETRINCLDRELLLLMKQAGCRGMSIGVETGDPEVLDLQAKPGVSLKDLESLTSLAGSLGLSLHFLLLVGLPREDKKSLYRTFRLIKNLRPASLGVSLVTPYPGTPLYWEAVRKGWLLTTDWEKYSGDLPVMRTDKLSRRSLALGQKMLLGCSWFSRRKSLSASLGLTVLDGLCGMWSYL